MRDLFRVFTFVFVVVLVGLIGPVLYAQGAALATGVPADVAASTTDELFASLIWGFLGSSALEYVKRKPWLNALLNEQTAWKIQRAWGLVVSAISALGIHVAFNQDAGTLVVSGLLLGSIYEFGKDWLKQWVLQEMIYRKTVKEYRPVTT